MRFKGVAAFVAVMALVVATFQWFEASIEVRVLCGNIGPDADREGVLAMFATAHRSEVRSDPPTGEDVLVGTWDLGATRCRVASEGGRVVSAEVERPFDLARSAGGLGLALLGALVLFQAALAGGAPWGRLAWGGAHPGRLPPGLRVASLASALALLVAGWAVAAKTGLRGVAGAQEPVPTILWVFVLVFGASVLGNLRSARAAERRLMTPVVAVLFVCVLVVAMAK